MAKAARGQRPGLLGMIERENVRERVPQCQAPGLGEALPLLLAPERLISLGSSGTRAVRCKGFPGDVSMSPCGRSS